MFGIDFCLPFDISHTRMSVILSDSILMWHRKIIYRILICSFVCQPRRVEMTYILLTYFSNEFLKKTPKYIVLAFIQKIVLQL